MSWLAWSLLALATWGVWGILPKIALQGMSWQQLLVFGSFSSFAVSLVVLAIVRPTLAVPLETLLPAIAAGLLGSVGVIATFLALSQGGKASVVIPLTAAYPVITVILSIAFLREEAEPTKLAAVVLFVIATVLVAR